MPSRAVSRPRTPSGSRAVRRTSSCLVDPIDDLPLTIHRSDRLPIHDGNSNHHPGEPVPNASAQGLLERLQRLRLMGAYEHRGGRLEGSDPLLERLTLRVVDSIRLVEDKNLFLIGEGQFVEHLEDDLSLFFPVRVR